MTRHRFLHSRSLAAVLAGAALSLAACGTATVDNTESTETDVPSASVSASSSTSSSAAKGSGSSSQATGSGGREARDGSVNEVTELPEGEERAKEEEDYLAGLADSGVDFDKEKKTEEQTGLEDQALAAGRAHCNLDDSPLADVLIPMAAGQFVEQGLFDGTPQQLEGIMIDAAKSKLCG